MTRPGAYDLAVMIADCGETISDIATGRSLRGVRAGRVDLDVLADAGRDREVRAEVLASTVAAICRCSTATTGPGRAGDRTGRHHRDHAQREGAGCRHVRVLSELLDRRSLRCGSSARCRVTSHDRGSRRPGALCRRVRRHPPPQRLPCPQTYEIRRCRTGVARGCRDGQAPGEDEESARGLLHNHVTCVPPRTRVHAER
jgi:hypothetical protein